MKYTKVIRRSPEGSKTIDIQTSIWNTILSGGIPLPEGVSYELAPRKNIHDMTRELMEERPTDPESLSGSFADDEVEVVKQAPHVEEKKEVVTNKPKRGPKKRKQ